MWVQSLSLTDLRSYKQVDCTLQRGVTTFVGRNGQGKTNLVEAIGYLATLGSHRVATDAPLVRTGATQGIIRCEVVNDERVIMIELAINPGAANKARINRSPVPKVRDVLGLLRTVLFAPEDLALVKGDPSERRRFLDDLLVQRTPRLAGTRSDYERTLKQRNALLKSSSIARRSASTEMLRTLEVWDEQLAAFGSELVAARISLLDDLINLGREKYSFISGDDETLFGMKYVSALGVDTPLLLDRESWKLAILDAIRNKRKEELDRGLTLIGPHRDDILLTLGKMPAKGYASHGESWSIALALRLASFDLLRADGVDPVLILDDVFAELDVSRRQRLAEQVSTATQVLITAAVDMDIPDSLQGVKFSVNSGTVTLQDPT
ncbi:MAG: DNA replication/repair protein RecF [Actinobacteria bacterium]|uniref:DNA replication and repair protein RecF n=1 Tax=freshwater metagenome TaxID=449393 RepID=A0A6J7AEV4_9ZZZZ|nr:DNA replication/repair protein RecF [Actinomycetota bacterium]